MRIIKYIVEGLAFMIVIIFIFNLISQFLQTLGLFNINQISYIGMVSVLLALDNLLTKRFFGYDIVK